MKNWLLPLIAVAVLAVLFVMMRPEPSPAPVAASPADTRAVEPASVEAALPSASTVPVPHVVELVVKEKKLVSGPQIISVPQGTPVMLRITVDHHDELHLHGYDLTLKLPTAEAAELSFVADRSGRFEYELHHAHVDLGVLEVQPR